MNIQHFVLFEVYFRSIKFITFISMSQLIISCLTSFSNIFYHFSLNVQHILYFDLYSVFYSYLFFI